MGRSRRTQGDPRPLTQRFDLRAEADSFAGELSSLLNHTVTDGIRIVAATDRRGQQASIGYGISRRNLSEPGMIPMSARGKPHLYLGLMFRMAADDAGKYPMIRASAMFLSPDPDGQRTLLHYDYERDKPDDYPDAHLQVCATSPEWEEVMRSYGPRGRPLERLHLPVGGRRYRPTVEDVIEFLIIEKLTAGQRGWREYLRKARERFRERQLRAAVRRNPDAAMAILREEGQI